VLDIVLSRSLHPDKIHLALALSAPILGIGDFYSFDVDVYEICSKQPNNCADIISHAV
jgi:hypothetical protein